MFMRVSAAFGIEESSDSWHKKSAIAFMLSLHENARRRTIIARGNLGHTLTEDPPKNGTKLIEIKRLVWSGATISPVATVRLASVSVLVMEFCYGNRYADNLYRVPRNAVPGERGSIAAFAPANVRRLRFRLLVNDRASGHVSKRGVRGSPFDRDDTKQSETYRTLRP
jgi:hypothetical protein